MTAASSKFTQYVESCWAAGAAPLGRKHMHHLTNMELEAVVGGAVAIARPVSLRRGRHGFERFERRFVALERLRRPTAPAAPVAAQD